MGTSSTVRFYKGNDEKPLVCIYHQSDGYISGVGHELAEFLQGITIINGLWSEQEEVINEFANGMGCLAAQYIAKFKKRVGGMYITNLDISQSYNYDVRHKDNQFEITVGNFKGTPTELLNYVED